MQYQRYPAIKTKQIGVETACQTPNPIFLWYKFGSKYIPKKETPKINNIIAIEMKNNFVILEFFECPGAEVLILDLIILLFFQSKKCGTYNKINSHKKADAVNK